jgi:hypothetical protein
MGKHSPRVDGLKQALAEQQHRAIERMAKRLEDELLVSRGLWERRLLGQVSQMWGYSPFASVLKIWHSQASLVASYTLMRSRTTAQMALVGLVQGTRWLTSQHQEHDAERRLENLALTGLNETELREAQLVIAGHVHAAGLQLPQGDPLDRLRRAAADVQVEFLNDASNRIDALILESAKNNSHWSTRCMYEVGFALLPGFLIYRIGRNFFYDSFWLEKPLLDTNFYIPSALFLACWAWFFVMNYTRRLRRGLTVRIQELAYEMAQAKAGISFFPELDERCAEFAHHRDQLLQLANNLDAVRDHFTTGRVASEHSRSEEAVRQAVPGQRKFQTLGN